MTGCKSHNFITTTWRFLTQYNYGPVKKYTVICVLWPFPTACDQNAVLYIMPPYLKPFVKIVSEIPYSGKQNRGRIESKLSSIPLAA